MATKHLNLLFWLSLGVGTALFVAMWLGFGISVSLGQVEGCVPFWDGCVSISRAARQWPGIIWFKSLMLPAAIAGGVFYWLLAAPRHKWLAIIGVIGSVFLLLYVIALGVDGDIYRLMRRAGVYVSTICTFAAQLRITWLSRHWQCNRLAWQLTAACILTNLLLCLVGIVAFALIEDDDWLENALEWPLAQLISWWALCFAWVLRTQKPAPATA